MQKRYLPVAIMTGVLSAVALVGYILPVSGEDIPKRILLPNAGGAVVFSHAGHAVDYNISCQTCHHESKEKRTNVQRCKTCHGVTYDAAFVKTHAASINDNAACVTCHHYETAPKKWGHERHQSELGLECTDCHHKDTSIEPEPQSCANCHESGAPTGKKAEAGTPPNQADAVHARCVSCHEGLFANKEKGCATCHTLKPLRDTIPQKGAVKLNPMFTNCAVCHDKPAQKLVPGAMDAYHKQCMGCHEKLGKGPYGKKACTQCHTGK